MGSGCATSARRDRRFGTVRELVRKTIEDGAVDAAASVAFDAVYDIEESGAFVHLRLTSIGLAATIFQTGPNHHTPWRYDLPGAFLVAVGWMSVSAGFGWYIERRRILPPLPTLPSMADVREAVGARRGGGDDD